MPTKEVPAAPVPFAIPDDVLAYCQETGIKDEFDKALAVVRDAFPDLCKVEIALEEHEVLKNVVVITGSAPGTPTDVAQRTWDCVGRWAEAVPRDPLLYFHLMVRSECE